MVVKVTLVTMKIRYNYEEWPKLRLRWTLSRVRVTVGHQIIVYPPAFNGTYTKVDKENPAQIYKKRLAFGTVTTHEEDASYNGAVGDRHL